MKGSWTDELISLVRMRKYTAMAYDLRYRAQFEKSIRFLELQLTQNYKTSELVQSRLLKAWWPHIDVILPSASGKHKSIRQKWENRLRYATHITHHSRQLPLFNANRKVQA